MPSNNILRMVVLTLSMMLKIFLLLFLIHLEWRSTCTSAQTMISCPEGFYCPLGNNSPRPCGKTSTHYCPMNAEHVLLTALGFFATLPRFDIGGGYAGQSICPRGSYCIDGVRYACPSGRYGSTEKMTNPLCSDVCPAGWYCPGTQSRR